VSRLSVVFWVLVGASLGAAENALAVDPLFFECRWVDSKGHGPFGVLVRDWNGDGRPDLAVSNAASETVSILLGTGGGRFSHADQISTGKIPRPLASADLDGDGKLDLAVGHASGAPTQVFRGDGWGGFVFLNEYSSGEHPFEIAFEDLDGDGKLDMVVLNESNAVWSGPEGKIGVHRGRGDGTFEKATILLAGEKPAGLAVTDLDGRPGLDIAAANWGSNDVSLFFREGEGFRKGAPVTGNIQNPYALAAEDLDGDGHADLAFPDLRGFVHVFWGAGDGTFPTSGAWQVGKGARWVEVADVDGDGRPDLLTADVLPNNVSILRKAGERRIHNAQVVKVGGNPRMVRAADFDGDGRIDLVVPNQADHDLTLLLQRDEGGERSCPPKAPKPGP
jgi:hypothetical protein